MRQFTQAMWVGAMVVLSATPATAEIECTFSLRSTVEGNMRLSGDRFRVRYTGAGLELEQRYADGSWGQWGAVEMRDSQDFTVYFHLPDNGDQSTWAWAGALIVYRTGEASLSQHFGSWGNSMQYRRGWLYQGTCE